MQFDSIKNLETQKEEIIFELNYQVIDIIDSHPIGARRIKIKAKNWLDACSKLRFRYGDSNVLAIVVTHVFRKNHLTYKNEFDYTRPGYISF